MQRGQVCRRVRRCRLSATATREWFETVAEARRRARRRLPIGVMALVAGAEKGSPCGTTWPRSANCGSPAAHRQLPAARDMATTVMGQEIALPVISPTGVQAVHPEGEVAVARAAAARGTAIGLSSFASVRSRRSSPSTPRRSSRSTGPARGRIAGAARAGPPPARGLIVTLDWSFSNAATGEARRSPSSSTCGRCSSWRRAPQPTPLGGQLGGRRPPGAGGAEHGGAGDRPPDILRSLRRVDADAAAVLGRPRWLREQWDGPFMVKGVMRADDARRAVDIGATRDFGVQPRRQQPRRHPGLDPRPARDRRRGRRPGRGPARRRDPPRQRRGQGAGARGPRRDDRPRLPVGPGGGRPGRGRERARHPARRDRLDLAGAGRSSVHELSRDDILVPPRPGGPGEGEGAVCGEQQARDDDGARADPVAQLADLSQRRWVSGTRVSDPSIEQVSAGLPR